MVKSARKPAVRAIMSGGWVEFDHNRDDSLRRGPSAKLCAITSVNDRM